MSESSDMRPDGNIGPYIEKSNIYIFGDPTNKTSCYIVSHGGHAFLLSSNEQFKVPSDTTVQFFLDHNEALVFGLSGFYNRGAPKIKRGGDNKIFTAGQICRNYILTKFQADRAKDPEAHTYKQLQQVAKDEDLLFVTIRHRRFHAARTLENTINEVQRALPQIKRFDCIHCRVERGFQRYYNAQYDMTAERLKNGKMGGMQQY